MIFKRNSGSYLSWKEYLRKIAKKQPLKLATKPAEIKQKITIASLKDYWYRREGIINTDLSLETISRIFSEQLRRLPMEGRW